MRAIRKGRRIINKDGISLPDLDHSLARRESAVGCLALQDLSHSWL